MRAIAFTVPLLALLPGLADAQEAKGGKPVQAVYQADVQPILKKYCAECHGETKPKGNVRLDKLSVDFVKGNPADLETWHDVLENLHRGEMPPKGKPQPTKQEHGVLVDWLNRAFVEARRHQESTGGKVVMRRLTAYEFQNTLQDLLGLDLDFGKDLLPEVPSRDGFLNNGSFLNTSSQHVKDFWAASRFALSQAIVTGPQPTVIKSRADTFVPFGGKGGGNKGKKNAAAPNGGKFDNVLLPDTALMTPIGNLPQKGRLRIRLNVRSQGPDTSLLAWFKLSGNNQTSLIFAKPEVRAADTDQSLDLFLNIEDHPLLVDFLKKSPVTGYLCVSNVGAIHFFRGGNGSIYPGRVDPAQAKEALDAKSTTVSAVRINAIEIEAPYHEVWPPSHHRRILFDSPNRKDEPTYAREVIAAFMERAFRRPVQKTEVDPYATAFGKIRGKVETFESAIRETLALVLVSPHFLYLVEPRDAKTAKSSVTDFEWAARLSYFLWNSMPDDELIQLAKKGGLADPVARRKQVDRLVNDSRSRRFIESFTDQWWNLPMLEKVAVNPEFHPDFDEDLKADMRRESQLFFEEFVKKDLSCLKLLDADFTFVNNRLADHYGLKAASTLGSAFRRVPLSPDDKRPAGILTQGSILLLNSDGVESHPIKRAVWVRNALFDDPPPEPPAEVPELKTEDRGKSNLTLKQRIEQHRSSQSCAHCHSRIDPWGLPLEQYDALGRFRTNYSLLASSASTKKGDDNDAVVKPKKKKAALQPAKQTGKPGTAVDPKAELPDGSNVASVADLQKYILNQGKERFARAVVRKTLAYALGRSLEVSDQPLIESLTRGFIADDYRYRKLLYAIVSSEPFITK